MARKKKSEVEVEVVETPAVEEVKEEIKNEEKEVVINKVYKKVVVAN